MEEFQNELFAKNNWVEAENETLKAECMEFKSILNSNIYCSNNLHDTGKSKH